MLNDGHATISFLIDACDKVHINWRLLLLNSENFERYLKQYKSKRRKLLKLSQIVVNRSKHGSRRGGVSLRVFERLKAIQAFCSGHYESGNLLVKRHASSSLSSQMMADDIRDLLQIDLGLLRGITHMPGAWRGANTKREALNYLIGRFEKSQFLISQSVSSWSILPQIPYLRSVYRKSSGFLIHDDKLPHIFLSSNDSPGRQIYTLLFLLSGLVLGEEDLIIHEGCGESLADFQYFTERHRLASEIVLPRADTDDWHTGMIDDQFILDSSQKYKITPKAVLTILQDRYPNLRGYKPSNNTAFSDYQSGGGGSSLESALRRFCSSQAFDSIMEAVSSKRLSSIDAQHLLFGRTNRSHWVSLKKSMGLI